jgi:hypothetical protein
MSGLADSSVEIDGIEVNSIKSSKKCASFA